MYKGFWHFALFGATIAFIAPSAHAQVPEPEPVNVDTPDGLRLAGTWYRGQGGKDSDCVLMLHNYGPKYNSDTKEWETLALALQKEGFSVLRFDLRGHGLNKGNAKAVNVPKDFCMNPFNKLSGNGTLHPDSPPKNLSLDVAKFKPGYYPYLINDIAGARYFLDKRNDQGQCNSGRINVIADRQICPLAMYWLSIEFARNGKYKANINDFTAPIHNAGGDIMSVVCLSYPTNPIFSIPYGALSKNKDIPEGIKNKVSVLFIDNPKTANASSNYWFTRWGIQGNKSDASIRKYIMPVEKSETLTGIDLLSAKKQLGVENEIVEFIKKTKTPAKGKVALTGNDWTIRNTGIEILGPVPVEDFGIKH